MALSDIGIRKYKTEKRVFLSDGNGLYLEVTKTGLKRWWVRYKIEGKTKRLSLKYYPEMSLVEARLEAVKIITELKTSDERIDPKEERERKRLEKIAKSEADARQAEIERLKSESEEAFLQSRLTFQGLYERWLKAVIKHHKDQGVEMERAFGKDVLPYIGHLYAEEVTRQQISILLTNITERGSKVMAGRTLTNIRQCFGYGIGIGLIEHDPTSHLKKSAFAGKAKMRDRVLSEDELNHLLQVALNESKLAFKGKAAIKVMLSTAVRVGELLKAKYEHIDLTGRKWVIPAENAKNAKKHLVHLSDYAIQAFEELVQVADHDIWLFTDRSRTKHICVKTLTKQISDRQTTAPLSNRTTDTTSLMLSGGKWTPHDLRRTAATLMGGLKIPPYVIEKCLNHTEENRMIQTYQHAPLYEERQQAFEALGRKLTLLSDPDAMHNEKIIQFNKYR